MPCKVNPTSTNKTASKRKNIENFKIVRVTHPMDSIGYSNVTAEVIFNCLAASNSNQEIYTLLIGETSPSRVGDVEMIALAVSFH